MKQLTLFFVALIMFSASCVTSNAQKTITVDGRKRSYLEYVPAGLGTKPALLISAHGMNQDAAYQKNMLDVASVADKEKFITVFPQGEGNAWDISGTKDINFIIALIDKMVADYGIDPNRVYMSGFSMGGMLTYHCMNKLYTKIAAFAPISGYPMGGYVCEAKVPLHVIHTHGTTDDVVGFSGVQRNLNVIINHNGCTKEEKTNSYKGYGHVTRHVWTGGSAPVVLMELANKGHWVSNDGLKTVQSIWEYCKNYSLEAKPVSISTNIKTGSTVPENVLLKVDASSTKADIARVRFYDGGKTFKKEITTVPYQYEYLNLSEGEHSLIAIAYDKLGNSNSITTKVTVKKGYDNFPAYNGDVNKDSSVNVKDINAIIDIMCSGVKNLRGDINFDDYIDTHDIDALISIMCK